MKSFINSKTIPALVIFSCIPGMLLRLWTRGAGPDEGGLFAPKPLAWILLWLLTAAVAFLIVYAVKGLNNPGTYKDNYPASLPALLCSLPAAFAMIISGIGQLKAALAPTQLRPDVIGLLTGLLGMAAGVCLIISGVCRMVQSKPFFLLRGIVCLSFALRLFSLCRGWSNLPQIGIVVFPFLASMALMVAAYHRTCFDVDMGNRPAFLFWSLISVYLSVVAIFSYDQPWYYGCCALWMATDLCSLRPLKRRRPAPEPEAAPVETPTAQAAPEAEA